MKGGDPRMPLPTPKPNEDKNEFIPRCLSSEEIKKEFDSEDQQYAVCRSQWYKNKEKEKKDN